MPTPSELEAEVGLHDIIYCGDGAYCGHDGWQVVVFTHNGYETLNRIALPPDGTWKRFREYADKHYERLMNRGSGDG